MDSMDSHVKTAAILRIVLGIPGIIAALIVLITIGGGGLLSLDPTAIAITSTVAILISTLLLGLHLPGLIAGIFVLRGHEWARTLLLIVSFFSVLDFPFGTTIGVYSIWALTRPDDPPASPQLPGGTPIMS